MKQTTKEIMPFILELLYNHDSMGYEAFLKHAIDHFEITEEEANELHKSGRPQLYNTLGLAIYGLKQQALIEPVEQGVFSITPEGKKNIEEHISPNGDDYTFYLQEALETACKPIMLNYIRNTDIQHFGDLVLLILLKKLGYSETLKSLKTYLSTTKDGIEGVMVSSNCYRNAPYPIVYLCAKQMDENQIPSYRHYNDYDSYFLLLFNWNIYKHNTGKKQLYNEIQKGKEEIFYNTNVLDFSFGFIKQIKLQQEEFEYNQNYILGKID